MPDHETRCQDKLFLPPRRELRSSPFPVVALSLRVLQVFFENRSIFMILLSVGFFRSVGSIQGDRSAAYQAAARIVAPQYGVERVHLDVYGWGARSGRRKAVRRLRALR